MMKYYNFYDSRINCKNSEQAFDFLIETLKDSIRVWDYFVNWKKVLDNYREVEISLNTLNYLIGKDNIEQEFINLLNIHPEIYKTIPILLACREVDFDVLVDYSDGNFNLKKFNFNNRSLEKLTNKKIESACNFLKGTGFFDLLLNRTIKSIPDYVLGVEVGLDTNGRKNRSGTTMETIVEGMLQEICDRYRFKMLIQPNEKSILKYWDIKITTDKTSRRFDYAIKTNTNMFILETNFYGGGGSKLKATAGEYISLFDLLHPTKFIWITDGIGWKTTKRSLFETFNHIEHLLNLEMVSKGILEEILLTENS